MSAGDPRGGGRGAVPWAEVAPLARALLAQATATLSRLRDDERDAPLAALDAFLAAPAPPTYLAASRALAAAERARGRRVLGWSSAQRTFERGLDAVRAVPDSGAALAAELAALPVDPRAGARLEALAALLTAHRELAERVAGQAAALRRPVAAAPASAAAAASTRPRRSRRAVAVRRR